MKHSKNLSLARVLAGLLILILGACSYGADNTVRQVGVQMPRSIVGDIGNSLEQARSRTDDLTQQFSIEALEESQTPYRIVTPDESIQATLDTAPEGTVLLIEPGTYKETLHIRQAGISLIGVSQNPLEKVIIENPGGASHGILVDSSHLEYMISNLTVQGFDEHGILLNNSQNYTLHKLEVHSNGKSGLSIAASQNGTLFKLQATNNGEAGIEIKNSSKVDVMDNQTHYNIIGISVVNSEYIKVGFNESNHNSAGLLASVVPLPDQKYKGHCLSIARNQFLSNNKENEAEEGSFCSVVPSGVGLMLSGVDDSHVEANQVRRNDFAGIGAISSLLLCEQLGYALEEFNEYQDPNPDMNIIFENTVIDNGTSAQALDLPGADLLWDHSGEGSCWMLNTVNTTHPEALNTNDLGGD